jgi:NAD(P)-dependent dehydrogenase (short-subunit alcohol dehydrogenase family)
MDRTRDTGKLGIVTGAGSGIGRATALRLAVPAGAPPARQTDMPESGWAGGGYAPRAAQPRSCRTQVLPSGSAKSANEP